MASSGNVEVVLEPAAVVEQPPVEGSCDDGESGLAATAASTEESQPMMLQEQEDMAPEADDHREAVAPDAEASAPEEEPDEQQEPAPVADSKEGVVEPEVTAMDDQESSRERLKRHRREMAGRVWVPEMWGQETLLKDWVDCAVFDRPLVPPGLLTARRALIAESCARRPDRTSPASSAGSSQRLRIERAGPWQSPPPAPNRTGPPSPGPKLHGSSPARAHPPLGPRLKPRAALRVAAVSSRNPYPNPSWPFHFFAQSLPRRSPPRLLRRRRHPRTRAPARCQTPKDGNFHISSPLQLHDHPTEQRASSDQHHKAAPASDELPSKEHADDTAELESEARLARRRRLQGEAHRSRGAGERDRRARGQLHPGRGRGCRPRPALLLPRRRVLHVRRQGPGGLHRPVGPVVPRRRPGRRRVRAHLRRVPDVRLRHPDAQGGRPVLAPRSHVISNS